MSDSEKLVVSEILDEEHHTPLIVSHRKKNKHKLRDRDDLSGLALNMFSKIDVRELFILWVVFIFIHTEMFSDHVLKRFNGTTNEDKTMTMKGTVYSSIFMIMIIVICSLLF